MNAQFFSRPATATRRAIRSAFTLVELLVVITIIGILMGLLIPAVNAAREAARRNQCSVNVKNLALAAMQHENSKGRLPPYIDKYGFNAGGDPSDPSVTAPAAHVKVGGYGVAILPWLDAQPTFEHWTEDRYPIISNGDGDIVASSGLPGTAAGVAQGFHGLAAPNLAIFQCPSNPRDDANKGVNSYVSNNGLSYMERLSGAAPTILPATPAPSNLKEQRAYFGELQSKNNGTSIAGYAGGKPADATAHGWVTEGPKITLDDLKDGQGFTALYSENVQALPWYLPGLASGADMTLVAGGEWNCSTGNPSNAMFSAAFTAGMVWHMADKDLAGGTHPLTPGGTTVPISAVNPKHRINGRGQTVSEDIFVESLGTNNYSDLARPSAAHVDGVNMGFADGATRFVTQGVDYRVYQAIMTPRGKSSDVPFAEFVLTDEISQ